MSVDTNSPEAPKTKHRKRHREQQGEGEQASRRKNHVLASSQSVEESPRKKHRSGKSKRAVADPQAIDPNHSKASPFRLQTSSLYLPLSPICQRYSLQGLCAEHLSPLILTYYPPFQSIILSYSNPRLSEVASKYGGAEDNGAVLALSVAEFAVSFVWLTVDFLVFKPQKGGWLEGWVNLQSEGHVGLVCWNLFNASIEKKRLPKEWRWVIGTTTKKSTAKLKVSREDLQSEDEEAPAVLEVPGTQDVEEDEGHFEDGEGSRIEGSIRFRVTDLDASMSGDREKSFLSIEGTLLSMEEEEKLTEQEQLAAQGGVRGSISRSGHGDYAMSGALGDGQVNGVADMEDMRLQLTVQRQGLPPAQVLWDTGALRPNHVHSGAVTTIAQLLEHINEVIPLEAEEWGLEDYAVEVHGFECLHFCSLNILKEDDRVIVRPLQTSDIRYRRVSGRHQISMDGKHLIDGVAFGRPFLRRADRPPVKISSRKRIRLTYDDEEDHETASPSHVAHQTLVRSVLNNVDNEGPENGEEGASYRPSGLSDGESDNDDESDEDNGIGEDLPGDLTEELHDITKELYDINQDMQGSGGEMEGIKKSSSYYGEREALGNVTRSRKRRKRNGLGLRGEGVLKLLEENNDHFPGGYSNPLLDQYHRDEPIQFSHRNAKRGQIHKARLGTSMSKIRQLDTPEGRSRQSSSASTKSVRFDDDEVDTPATIRKLPHSQSEEDGNFEPDAGQVSGSTESNKENVQPSQAGDDLEASSDDIDFGSSASDAESSSSSSNSSSDVQLSPSSSGSTSSSSSGRTSTSSSGRTSSLEQTNNSDQKSPDLRPILKHRDEAITKDNRTSRASAQEQEPTSTPPGKGHRKTQKRNERRRVHKRMTHLKSIGVLSSTASMEDYHKYIDSRSTENLDSNKDDETQVADIRAAFEAKKRSLLESIASSGVDIDHDGKSGPETPDTNQHVIDYDAPESRPEAGIATTNGDQFCAPSTVEALDATQIPDVPSVNPVLIPSTSKSSQRRSQLDVASTRRLLFGSLGLRTPKNKEDEARLREKIMENVRPIHQPQGVQEDGAIGEISDSVGELDDNWRERIHLKAVECCHDGIELSTPPFPFVQRWDPQQKSRLGNGQGSQGTSRRKKRKRNQKQFSQEEEAELNQYSAPAEEHEVDKFSNLVPGDEENQSTGSLTHPVMSDDYQLAVDTQLLQDTTNVTVNSAISVDDLPSLPEDITACIGLEPGLALPGAVIAFKQLDMSQETNWQPKISEYRTAIINRTVDGRSYQITLARRDQPRKERFYDRETGERLYSKFEMPEYENEDDDNDDNGGVELTLEDMIEPKLIRGVDNPPQAIKSSTSHVPEIERVDMSEVFEEGFEEDAQSISVSGKEEEPNEDESFEVNEETRQEISLIIKDAGFRSHVPSDLERGLESHDCVVSPPNTEKDGSRGTYEIQSPKFHGFSSSPPAEECSFQTPGGPDVTVQTTSWMTSTDIVGMKSSQPDEFADATKEQMDETSGQDWEPEQIEDDSAAYPTLLCSSQADDRDLEGPAAADISSSPSTKNTKHATYGSKGRGFMSRTKALLSASDDADSDDDLPTMESVFSTARSRVDEAIPDSDDAKEEPKSESSGREKKAFTRKNTFRRRTIPVFSVDDVLASSSSGSIAEAERHDRGLLKGGGSQPPPGSQIVDLTLTSDPVEPDGSEYEERDSIRGLPRGPGWVQKTRGAGKGRRLRPETGGRKTRSM